MNYTYISAGGMLLAIPNTPQQKREDIPGPKKAEEYRQKTACRGPLTLAESLWIRRNHLGRN